MALGGQGAGPGLGMPGAPVRPPCGLAGACSAGPRRGGGDRLLGAVRRGTLSAWQDRYPTPACARSFAVAALGEVDATAGGPGRALSVQHEVAQLAVEAAGVVDERRVPCARIEDSVAPGIRSASCREASGARIRSLAPCVTSTGTCSWASTSLLSSVRSSRSARTFGGTTRLNPSVRKCGSAASGSMPARSGPRRPRPPSGPCST